MVNANQSGGRDFSVVKNFFVDDSTNKPKYVNIVGSAVGLGALAAITIFGARACGPEQPVLQPSPTPTIEATLAAPTAAPEPTITPKPTYTLVPTATAMPTSTPVATATPKPTSTSVPTATPYATAVPSTPLPTSTSYKTPTRIPITLQQQAYIEAVDFVGGMQTDLSEGRRSIVSLYIPVEGDKCAPRAIFTTTKADGKRRSLSFEGTESAIGGLAQILGIDLYDLQESRRVSSGDRSCNGYDAFPKPTLRLANTLEELFNNQNIRESLVDKVANDLTRVHYK